MLSWIPLFSCVLVCFLIICNVHVGSCVVLCALLFSCVFLCYYVVSIVIVSFVLNCFRSSLGNVISTTAGSRHPLNNMHIKYIYYCLETLLWYKSISFTRQSAFLDSFVLLCSPVFSYYLQCPCGFMCCPLRSSLSFGFICFHFVSIVIVSFGFNCFRSSLGNVVSTAAGSRHPLNNMHIKCFYYHLKTLLL